jgi:hypothetical protein
MIVIAGTLSMSTVENIVRSHSQSLALSDELTMVAARQLDELTHYLGTEVWVARSAVCCGFAGAVLVQAALFSLVAQLLLNLDTALLPNLAVSVGGLVFGAFLMLGNRALLAPPTKSALS